ncbi:hypothetical protein IDJ81_05770 [Tsuneonella flava]|uniref:Uncharacterized protein n=1 Tax=Tsuneonella flava TaxID=2055955 RepID=A0ABX7KE87_9SPHN|nr:hypothetical protein [Tsuneonella flava]QSB45614.1 hypothetical protein IDJ81_05770 [Tsuneonella flava]
MLASLNLWFVAADLLCGCEDAGIVIKPDPKICAVCRERSASIAVPCARMMDMNFRKVVLAAGSLVLVATPVVAQAAQIERASKPAEKSNSLFKDRSLLLVIATIAIVAGAIVLATNDDEPASP